MVKQLSELIEKLEEENPKVQETPFLTTELAQFDEHMKTKYGHDLGTYLAARYLRYVLTSKAKG